MGGFDEMDEQVSVGQTLRQRREERGLSLEQAAYQSKVPLRLVQVLESDDYRLLPDALYLIRLLHDYAVFLQLDPTGLEDEFREAVRRPPRPSLAPPSEARTAPVIPWKQVLWTVIAILVVTPLVFIALSLMSKREQERVAQAPKVEPRAEESRQAGEETGGLPDRLLGSVTPSASQTSATTAEEVPASSAGPREAEAVTGVAATAETASGRHILIARAHEPSWLSVRPDQGERRQVLLQPGQTARFEAETGFQVTLGNAGGVALWFDGTSLPSQGRPGEVIRDLVLPLSQGSPSVAKAAPDLPQR